MIDEIPPFPQRHLTWQNFERDYLGPALPALLRLEGEPPVDLFVEQGGVRIGLLIDWPSEDHVPSSSMREIAVRRTFRGGHCYVEFSTESTNLFYEFHALALRVADMIQLDGAEPLAAIEAGLERWAQLLSRESGLSTERELGLLGELWVLERLLNVRGGAALAAWTGPDAQEHDFRLPDHELEVKTTSRQKRIHTINGFGQLRPSPDARLSLLSVQMCHAGPDEGRTLPEQVSAVRAAVDSAGIPDSRLDVKLASAGYDENQAGLYATRWKMRSPARLIPVDASVPALIRTELDALLGPTSERLVDIEYEIDVEGLGVEQPHPDFIAVIPEAK